MKVPPRFSRRSTRMPRASSVCASISPRRICSVKFFDPTRIGVRIGGWRRRARRPPPAPRRPRPRRPTAATGAATELRAHPAFGERQPAVERQRQDRRRDRTGEDHGRIDHREAAEDVLAEPAGADRRRNRRRPHANHRGDTDARDDRRQRQRQLHLTEQLPRRHPERLPASTSAGSTDRMPAIVVRTIGSSA